MELMGQIDDVQRTKNINLNINADVERLTLVKLNEDFIYLTNINNFDLNKV